VRRLLTFIALCSLLLAVAVAQPGWKLTSGTSRTTNRNSGGNSTLPRNGGGGSSVVCHKNGLSANATLSGNMLNINYTGSTIGSSVAKVLAEWSAYKNCVTTSPTKAAISCFALHVVYQPPISICKISLSIIPVKWGNPGSPGSSGYPTWLSSCAARIGNPTITIPEKLTAATVTYAPVKRWLINLPVEYTYTNPQAPQTVPTQISGESSVPCNGPTFTSTQLPNKSNGYKYRYRYLSTSVQLNNVVTSARFASRSGVFGNIYPDSQYAGRAGFNSGFSLQTVSCAKPNPLVPVASIPDYPSLAQYTALFNRSGVCNFVPDSAKVLDWVAAIHTIVPTSNTASTVQFVLGQNYFYNVTVHTVGTVSSSCLTQSQYQPPNRKKWKRINSNNCGFSYPVSFPSSTQQIEASAAIAKSIPVPIDFISVQSNFGTKLPKTNN